MDFDISISVLVFFRLVFAVSPFILNSRYPFFFFFGRVAVADDLLLVLVLPTQTEILPF